MDSQTDTVLNDSKNAISGRSRRLMALWGAGLVLLYVVIGTFGVRQLQEHKALTEAARQDWRRVATGASGTMAPQRGSASEGSPVNVSTGIRVRRIGGFSLKDAEWTADFDIWFRWSGEGGHPGETFDVVNGDIQRRDKIEAWNRDGQNYERYHVRARMVALLDPASFPFGDEELPIEIQDNCRDLAAPQYVFDENGTGLAPDALPLSVKLKRTEVTATTLQTGQEKKDSGRTEAVHSRLVFAMLVTPVSTSSYLMMFQALFASVAVAMIVFFVPVKYDNTRFALPVGAFFMAVANNIFVSSLLPRADGITLTNMVNGVSLITIFLILVQSTISLYFAGPRGWVRLSRMFDKVSFAVLLPCYAVLNLLLPWAAMSA